MGYIWWKREGDSCDAGRFENRGKTSSRTYHACCITAIIQAYAGDTSTAVYGLVDFGAGTKSVEAAYTFDRCQNFRIGDRDD